MTLNNEQIIAILQATINDLIELGSGTDNDFDDYNAQAIARFASVHTHRSKFFIANRRITQLSKVIEGLRGSAQGLNDHEF